MIEEEGETEMEEGNHGKGEEQVQEIAAQDQNDIEIEFNDKETEQR